MRILFTLLAVFIVGSPFSQVYGQAMGSINHNVTGSNPQMFFQAFHQKISIDASGTGEAPDNAPENATVRLQIKVYDDQNSFVESSAVAMTVVLKGDSFFLALETYDVALPAVHSERSTLYYFTADLWDQTRALDQKDWYVFRW